MVEKGKVEGAESANAAQVAVAVVAEDASLRRRLAKLLTAEGMTIAARASNPEGILQGFANGSKALVVLCCTPALAQGSIRALRQSAPGARIVLIADQAWTGRALRSVVPVQADAVVYSDQLREALGPSIRAVVAEQIVFPRRDRRQMVTAALSHRERQVLRLAAQGRTNDEIASRLYLATSTVKSHLTSAFAKLAVGSRSETAAPLFDPGQPIGRAVLAGPLGDAETLPGR